VKETSDTALDLVKSISSFILEHEASFTTPTTVHINKDQRDSIKLKFPYLIEEGHYIEREHKLRIILNDPSISTVGVGFTYFTEKVGEYE